MPKLPRVNARETVAALLKAGFLIDHYTGSYDVLELSETHRGAVVPEHGGRDLAPGTSRRILRQAGLTGEEFIALLK
jgi:predicted RNA binding protein YcfA (HicA-like mRNA interferase family)